MGSFDVEKELETLLKNIQKGDAETVPTPKPKTAPTKTQSGIKIIEDKTDYSKVDDSKADYYSGEVYFASKKPVRPVVQPKQQRPIQQPLYSGSSVAKKKAPLPNEQIGGKVSRAINKFLRDGGQRAAIIYVLLLIIISILLSLYMLSLANDIFAFTRGDDVKTVTVSENATTNQVISQLDKAGLIKHGTFCKFFMAITKSLHEISGPPVYLSGVYYLTPSMGLEKMLLSCQETRKAETVIVTIPEGFSITQIATRLEKSKVCMSDEFYSNLQTAEFNYKFLETIENKSSRFHYLEGYLYPDTYEFYVDQNASSVINTMLSNFNKKWTKEYQARADEIGMTVDEVIILASIVQREAADAEQMPLVAGIFVNRLNSTTFASLQANATTDYVNNYIKPKVTTGEYDIYLSKYGTYKCIGLPVGPISCPGDDAIRAVLWPAKTEFYYFCHDPKGNIYTAVTSEQHNINVYKALRS
ncbi:MAG: endolytic transglycosylase MltG [Ruminococcaceae bacterium]|nr:endolytic transglycosylase MltG [Oscillospiraceae bacterium]